jgi:cytochrome c
MQANKDRAGSVSRCTGECYQQWQTKTGGTLALAAAASLAKASASPAELGEKVYLSCIACHGAGGEGGIGPTLEGQSIMDIAGKLAQYKNGETLGKQSALMWSQAAQLSAADIDNLAAYIETL